MVTAIRALMLLLVTSLEATAAPLTRGQAGLAEQDRKQRPAMAAMGSSLTQATDRAEAAAVLAITLAQRRRVQAAAMAAAADPWLTFPAADKLRPAERAVTV
jgi:hypothetical protein